MTPGVTSFCARIYVSLKRGPGAAPGTDARRLSKPASALRGPGAAGSSLPAGKRGREGRAPGPRSRANRVSETQGLDPSPASQQTAQLAAVHSARTKPGAGPAPGSVTLCLPEGAAAPSEPVLTSFPVTLLS